MVNDENRNDTGIEKMLKDQMDALAENVDCYGDIISKLYPQRDVRSSEEGFIDSVDDVENITGKKRVPSLLKFGVVSAAALVAFASVPKFITLDLDRDSGMESAIASYQEILTDVKNAENNASNYNVYDLTLEEYAQNDVLIDPLFRCPFELDTVDDAKVKLFIRKNQYFNTNEVYAVEYKGDYKEENFIAAASSGVKFTEKELSEFDNIYEDGAAQAYYKALMCPEGERFCGIAAEHNFKGADNGGLTDLEGKPVSAAAYSFNTIYKDDDGILPIATSVLYYHDNSETKENSEFKYDTYSFSVDKKTETVKEFEPETDNGGWEISLYSDGISAFPEKEYLEANQAELFFDLDEIPEKGELEYVMPYAEYFRVNISDRYAPSERFKAVTSENNLSAIVSTIGDMSARRSMMIFGARGKLVVNNGDQEYSRGLRVLSTKSKDSQTYLGVSIRITPAATLSELRENRMQAKRAYVKGTLDYCANDMGFAYTYEGDTVGAVTNYSIKYYKIKLDQARAQVDERVGFKGPERVIEAREKEILKQEYLKRLDEIIGYEKSALAELKSLNINLKENLREWNPDASEEEIQMMYKDAMRSNEKQQELFSEHLEKLNGLKDKFDELMGE